MKLKHLILGFAILFGTIAGYTEGFGKLTMPKQQFLDPKEAFQVTATREGDTIKANITLGDKIYIYAKDLHFKVTKPIQAELTPALPPAEKHGEFDIYHSITVDIPAKEIESKVAKDYTLTVEMTGCSDSGICYSPQTRDFKFKYKGEAEGFFGKISRLAKSGNTDMIADALANESSAFILLLFFIAGLLMALTPCILPMIPILSSIIIQQANKEGEVKRVTAFAISFVYVLFMALTYALIGVVAGLLDFDLQANMNNPWIIIPLAGIFVALAFSLFGYFELGLPASWQAKLTKASDNAQGKGLIGTAIMGSLSALIVGACTAPIISGAIIFIMLTGKAVLGGVALFVMGIGAGIPLLLVGAGANKLIPKPGGWMDMVSKFFGLLMLAMALLMLSRLIPSTEAEANRGYSIERLQKEIKATDKPVLVDIYKAGCAACTELEEITFVNPAVIEELKRFKFIHIDITQYTDEDKALLKKYQLFGAPNLLLFDSNNTPIKEKFMTGFIPPEQFLKRLKSIQ
jgi:thiol:disulfide interchange protein DsbD